MSSSSSGSGSNDVIVVGDSEANKTTSSILAGDLLIVCSQVRKALDIYHLRMQRSKEREMTTTMFSIPVCSR